MHYYTRNIGDYAKKTGRLSTLEHGAYTLLLDAYYDRERAPSKREAIEWSWARTTEEIQAVEFVLDRFFDLIDDHYHNKRVDEEIALYRAKALKNKEIAIQREEKRKKQKTPAVHESCTNRHLTNNQEPITNNHKPKEEREEVDKTRFVPPSKQETADFFASNSSTIEEAGKFWYHFDSNGWKVGGRTKMKSWTSAAKKWILTAKTNVTTNGHAKRNGTLGYQQPITAADLPDIMQSIADDPRYK